MKVVPKESDLMVFAPAIWFHQTKKKKDEDKESDTKDKYQKFYVPVDREDENNEQTTEWAMKVYESGSAEEYIRWRIQFDELATAMLLDTPDKKFTVLQTILRGEARAKFNGGYHKLEDLPISSTAAAKKTHEEKRLKAGFDALAKPLFIPTESAWRRQRTYLRYHLRFNEMSVSEFKRRLEEMNKYLKYFPVPSGKESVSSLTEEELVEIIDRAKPIEYQLDVLAADYDPYSKSLQEYVEYLERLETKANIRKQMAKKDNNKSNGGTERSPKKDRKRNGKRKRDNSGDNEVVCGRCKKPGHATKDCWDDPKNADNRPAGYKKRKKDDKKNDKVVFNMEQMSFLMKNFQSMKSNPKSKKRKVTDDSSDEDSEDAHFLKKMTNSRKNDTSDDDSMYSRSSVDVAESSYSIGRPRKKKAKTTHSCAEVIVEIRDRTGEIVAIRTLLDTGTSSTMILRKFVHKNLSTFKHKPVKWKTLGGIFTTKRKARVEFKLPEFSTTKTITWNAHVDEFSDPKSAQYDMIIGTDLMEAIGIDLSFSSKTLSWDGIEIPMKNRGLVSDRQSAEILYQTAVQSPILQQAESRHKKILDADYSKVDIVDYVNKIDHLKDDIKQKLIEVLQSKNKIFEGGLGTLDIKPIHIELKKDATPYHAKPFPVPKAYEATTKKESDRFAKIGVWYHNPHSRWAAPTFIIPKKTGDVRMITDLRELNKRIVRKPYPLPKIQDLLQKLEQFSYASALDLSMGYYHIPLDKESQELCTTILPWGKYSYAKLPMGLSTSPDIFQSIMNELLGDLPYVLVYLDDILILNKKDETEEEHLQKIDVVLKRLEKVGFAVNLRKSFFLQTTIEYLGYLLTPNGIQPQPKKVEAISRVLPPKNRRQLRRFLGLVNYYRDMWKRRSHVLAPLAALASKTKAWKWTETEQSAFEQAKQMVMREAQLTYPDFSKEFHIYTDASDYQLGGVIMQENKPLAYYTRKLNRAQAKYPTGEQELLSIVETLKAFENILLGQRIVVHTDHLNLLYKKLASNRLVRWRMLIEEFGPQFVHVKGEENVAADALSRLDIEANESDEIITDEEPRPLSYMQTKEILNEEFPMLPSLIRREQMKDEEIMHDFKNQGSRERYYEKNVEGVKVIHDNGKIRVPKQLQQRILEWYHQFLVHPGKTRMEATIRSNFTWPNLTKQVEQYCKTCHQCQLFKKQRKKYGHLPAKTAEVKPWQRVNVDLIGPYTVKTPKKKHQLRAMTMIDPATGWFEIAPIIDPTSDECQRAFDSCWLARYPRPAECGFDNGKEFKWLFAELCDNMGLKKKPTTDYNPQGNAIIERVHQVLGNSLRTFELEERELDAHNPFEPFLTATAYAIRSTFHTTLKATPGQLVFGRDMLLPIQFKADWAQIALRKQSRINESNKRENSKRIDHQYKPGDKVLLEKPGITPKMVAPRTGPYEVTTVSTNGTVRIRKGAVTHRVNIRRLTPYHERQPSGSA